MRNKLLYIFLIISSLFYISELSADSDDILASISNNMNHYTKVATQTKENEHYQPYVISVFKGKDLEKLGIVSLEEALSLIPGVDMSTNNYDIKAPIFRGSNPEVSGQSKLFIDGVLANSLYNDAYSEYMGFPIEFIKRIEVIRGPGSKTDGYNAYAGSINVITYAENIDGYGENDSVIAKYGSFKYGMFGFIKSYKLDDDYRLTTDFYYKQDDKKVNSGLDGLGAGYNGSYDYSVLHPAFSGSLSYDNTAIGGSNDALLWSETLSLGVTFTYKDIFYTKLRLLDHTQGAGHGSVYYATDDKNSEYKYPNYSLEIGVKDNIGDFDISVKGGIKYDKFDINVQSRGDGWNVWDYGKFLQEYRAGNLVDANTTYNTPLVFANGQYTDAVTEQMTYYQSSFVEYDGIRNHNIKLGYMLRREETIDTYSKTSTYATGIGMEDISEFNPFFNKDAERNTVSLFFEDSYTYSDSLSFLFGYNYEKASKTLAQYEPKISMVYQANRNNIFKLLYAESHRNPSWAETFSGNNDSRNGSTEFEPEKVKAYEAAYIYKIDSSQHIQANIFYLQNTDQLQVVGAEYTNVGETDIYGLELEYKGYITSNDMFYFNYSYTDGEATNTGTNVKTDYLASVAKHMAKAYYSYDITSELSASTVIKYVGEKKRSLTDIREPTNDYTKVDLTTRYDSEKYGYSLMLSVKNVFDSDIRFSSPENTYDDDYQQEGRNFMITLKKEF